MKIGPECVIGPDVTLGPEVCIEDGVRIQDSAILSGATIRSHSWLDGSIVGWNSDVGRWVSKKYFWLLILCISSHAFIALFLNINCRQKNGIYNFINRLSDMYISMLKLGIFYEYFHFLANLSEN